VYPNTMILIFVLAPWKMNVILMGYCFIQPLL
jgi:hypothetical protein